MRESPPDRIGIWLIPTINPDGYARYERHNANGVDLNRDGGNSFQQVETRALMDFLRSVRPTRNEAETVDDNAAAWLDH